MASSRAADIPTVAGVAGGSGLGAGAASAAAALKVIIALKIRRVDRIQLAPVDIESAFKAEEV